MLGLLLAAPAQAQEFAATDDSIPGYGRGTTGGAGFPICPVTVLAGTASTVGTLEYVASNAAGCLKTNNGGNVVSWVTGKIALESALVITTPNVTIDLGSAPGQGVGLTGKALTVCASNVIVRNVRHRGGTSAPSDKNIDINSSCDVFPVHHVWLDHNSMSHSNDTCSDALGSTQAGVVSDFTISYNLMSETAGVGGSFGGGSATRGSYFRNAYVSNGDRNPHLCPGAALSVQFTGASHFDVAQTLVYNFAYGSDACAFSPTWSTTVDFMDGYYLAGPTNGGGDAPEKIPIMVHTGATVNLGTTRVYLSGNETDYRTNPPAAQSDLFACREANVAADCLSNVAGDGWDYFGSATRFGTLTYPPSPAKPVLKDLILRSVGATRPCRDSEDLAQIASVRNQTNAPNGDASGRLPNSQWTGGEDNWGQPCPAQ